MTKKKYICSVLNSSIDWFTVTTRIGLRSRFAAAKAERIMREWEQHGGERKDANRLGFVGQRIDHLFYGYRADTLIIIGSSDIAEKHASFFVGLAENVTRLDLAVTLLDSDHERDWTAIALKQVLQDGRVQGGSLTTHRIEGTPNGRTLYIGARSSDRYIRIYDKSAQDPGAFPETAWRWEIEYKQPRAGSVAKRLLTDGCTSRAILEHCKATFADLRVALPASTIGEGWIAHRPARVTTAQTRLKYAQRVIGPFLKNLVDQVGEDEVARALDRSFFTRSQVISQETGEVIQ